MTDLVVDTFTDVDGTSAASHSPDTNTVPGAAYRAITVFGTSPTAIISSNTLKVYSSSTSTAAVVIDSGYSDAIVSCSVNKNGATYTNGGTGLVFRASGTTYYIVDILYVSTSPKLRLRAMSGKIATWTQTVAFTHNNTTTYTVKAVLSGSSIKVYVDNILYYDITDTTYTGTEHGPALLSGSPWADNLSITTVVPPKLYRGVAGRAAIYKGTRTDSQLYKGPGALF